MACGPSSPSTTQAAGHPDVNVSIGFDTGSERLREVAHRDDIDVAVGLYVLLNRDIAEDVLGRALSADELAAINAAGSHVAVTPT